MKGNEKVLPNEVPVKVMCVMFDFWRSLDLRTFSNQSFVPLQKTATAVAYCKRGRGLLRVNGRPLEQIEPKVLQYKLQEPLLLLGKEKFAGVDIRIRVSGGGHVAQVYAIRQAISKALVSYYQKCE